MRIKDVINVTQGLFQYINYPIDTFTNSELDFLFITKYGERELSPTIESLVNSNGEITNEKMVLLGQIINKMFSHSWDNQNTILEHEFNPYENYYETIETLREIDNNNTTNTDNNTYAFNSVDSVDKDNTNQTSEGNTNESVTQTKTGLTNSNYLDIVENALKVKAIKMVDIIFNDIKWFMSLDIYK